MENITQEDARSNLLLARELEGQHLNRLRKAESCAADEYWGSEEEIELGNRVFNLCLSSGLDLEAETDTFKATAVEICELNIACINEKIAIIQGEAIGSAS